MSDTTRRMIESYIMPLLPSAFLTGPHDGSRRQRPQASFDGINKIRLYLPPDDNRYYLLKRLVPFSPEELNAVADLSARMNERLLEDGPEAALASGPAVLEEVIAQSFAPECPELVQKIIAFYRDLPEQPNPQQGGHNIGICLKREQAGQGESVFSPEHMAGISKFGSMPDTLLVLDSKGCIINLENFNAKTSHAARQNIFSPIAVAGLAFWTGTGQKIALRRTPEGDILLFRNRTLMFVRRRSGWHCLPHSLIMGDFAPHDIAEKERAARRAVYLTAMDLAFGGREACMFFTADATPPEDLAKCAGKLALSIVKGKKFFELDRELRADLCVIDGGILLDKAGTVLGHIPVFTESGPPVPENQRSRLFGLHVHQSGRIDIYKGRPAPFSIR